MHQVHSYIRKRKSIFPKFYSDKPIERKDLEEILETANWAPSHKNTEPWRFQVFYGDSLNTLASYMADTYKATTPEEDFSERVWKKRRNNVLKSGAVIIIIFHRDPEERVPEWEELAAVSCAVQNIWLASSAMGIGGYWSTPKIILQATEFLNLASNEKCLGMFYLGYHDMPEVERSRGPIEDKVVWR